MRESSSSSSSTELSESSREMPLRVYDRERTALDRIEPEKVRSVRRRSYDSMSSCGWRMVSAAFSCLV